MLSLQLLREHSDFVIERLAIKGFDAKEPIATIIDLDVQRRDIRNRLDNSLAEGNRLSKELGELFKSGRQQEAVQGKERVAELKVLGKELEMELEVIEKELNDLLLRLPNLPHASVPSGRSAEDNEIVQEGGSIPSPDFELQPHWDLLKKYDLVDFELGNKITGAGFPIYKGKGAKLQRALISFFLDEAVKAGYTEVQPPLLVNADSAYGTGQLPDKDGQMYHCAVDDFYLIPTAEVPVTNIYRNEMLRSEDLPYKNTAYSQCFRREAGSYGKDVRGLNRLHQFDKVEIVQIVHPDTSYATLEEMRSHVSGLIEKLGLPFRVLRLCGGDMSFTSALTYDMEVYSAGQQRWLEVSSVSNFESFQSNRMKIRFKDENGKSTLVHTLNGSALALPRIVAAIIENYQTPNGIQVPEVLVPYTIFTKI